MPTSLILFGLEAPEPGYVQGICGGRGLWELMQGNRMEVKVGDGRTIIGVVARDGAREWPVDSEKEGSRKCAAVDRVASDVSHACSDSIIDGMVVHSSMLEPMDRNTTSSANCVRPRCDLDPNIVCVYKR